MNPGHLLGLVLDLNKIEFNSLKDILTNQLIKQ